MRDGGASHIRRIVEHLSRRGGRVEPVPTPGPNASASLAREASRSADLIIVFGGDGTVNEVAEGLIGSETPLLALPGGTANVLANEIGFSSSLTRALARVDQCVPRRIAAGRATNARGQTRHFLMMAGAGLDAHIVHTINPGLKRRLGKGAYWIAGFSQIVRPLPVFEVEVEGRRYRASFALASRVRNYGGDLEIARSVTLDDDDFEVVLFAGSNPLRYLVYFPGVLLNQLPRIPGVTVLRARSLRICGAGRHPACLQIDGEAMGFAPATIDVAPAALTLWMPAAYGSRSS